jgi:hypothetical protein
MPEATRLPRSVSARYEKRAAYELGMVLLSALLI